MDAKREAEQTSRAMREFALACQAERDRLAQARLDADERRLGELGADALVAQVFVARLLHRLRA